MAVKIKCVISLCSLTSSLKNVCDNLYKQKWCELRQQHSQNLLTKSLEQLSFTATGVWKNASINLRTLKFNFTDNLTVTQPMTSKQVYYFIYKTCSKTVSLTTRLKDFYNKLTPKQDVFISYLKSTNKDIPGNWLCPAITNDHPTVCISQAVGMYI